MMTEPLQIESPQANINRVRFAGKDFFTFVDDLVARIQLLFVTEFNDFVASGTGVMLIDMVGWACETLSFYIDRQATESYISTARTRRAINRLARQIGYKMRAAVSASVDLEINLQATYAFDVPIPTGFKFKGPNGTIWEAVESITFPAGEGPLSPARTISCTEGYTREEIFASNGQKNQSFRLSPGTGRYVADDSVVVMVASALWNESPFISFDATDQYEVDYNTDPPLLRFGDTVAGNVPLAGAEIRASYISTSGLAGLVLHDTIKAVNSPLVVAFQTIPLTITNPNPSSGGDDRESIEEARRNAPLFFYARNAAVTKEDYVGLSQEFSDPIAGVVAVAQAFVALGADDDLALQAFLNDIRGIVNTIASSITGSTATAQVAIDALQVAQSSAASESSDIATSLASIGSEATSARSSANAAHADVIQAEAQVAAARTKVTSIGDGGAVADQLSSASYSELLGYFTSADSETGQAKSAINSSIGNLDTIDSEVVDGQDAQVQLSADLVTIGNQAVIVEAQLGNIDAAITIGFEDAIGDILDLIFDHVDNFLADDCKANLVQVPILARDVNGFFTAPSAALINALQTYLEGIKEVTQVPEVVSGESWLVGAIIEGTIGVADGYVKPTVLSNVLKALDDILRGREFGQNLYLNEIMSVTPDPLTGIGGVEGVSYGKLRITGPIAFLDSIGQNLVIEQNYIITKGSVSIVTETADF
jgi:hypothetical protein